VRSGKTRWGTSLTEVMVAVSVGSVVLAAATATLSAFLRAERSGRDHLRQTLDVGRLSQQFRSDVAAATAASMPADAKTPELRLDLAGGRQVVYRADGPLLRRDATGGEKAAHHETYRFPGCALTLSVRREPADAATIAIARKLDPEDKPLVRISARVSRYQRLTPEGD